MTFMVRHPSHRLSLRYSPTGVLGGGGTGLEGVRLARESELGGLSAEQVSYRSRKTCLFFCFCFV